MEQCRGLLDGGADVLLVETIFDTANSKVTFCYIVRVGCYCEKKIIILLNYMEFDI